MEVVHPRTVSILDILAKYGECELDELILLCRGLGWHDTFREVDRLRRDGHIRLVAKGCGIYVVNLQTDGVPLASVHSQAAMETHSLLRQPIRSAGRVLVRPPRRPQISQT